jgi:transposase-like protein
MPKDHQAEARTRLCAVPKAERQALGAALRTQWTTRHGPLAPKAVERLADDWERLVTFYPFPQAPGRHLRPTTGVASPFAAGRLRTTAANCFKKVDFATASSGNCGTWPRAPSGDSRPPSDGQAWTLAGGMWME